MIKLYKKDKSSHLLYMETWINNNIAITHYGKVGKKGEVIELDHKSQFKNEQAYFDKFQSENKLDGYHIIEASEQYWMVVQYPLKSLKGSKRDHWLKDKATEYLNHELGWTGLGHVDGFDIGAQAQNPKKYVLNIFCMVVDDDKAVAAAKRCLREARLDYTHIKIAIRKSTEEDYTLQHTGKTVKDKTFAI